MNTLPRPRTPFGFFVAGTLSAVFAVAMAYVACSPGALGMSHAVLDGAARVAAAVMAALAAVVTEALWRARPWAFRASMALALAFTATVIAIVVGSGMMADPQRGLGVLFLCECGLFPILAYIRERTHALWVASPPVRVPTPPAP